MISPMSTPLRYLGALVLVVLLLSACGSSSPATKSAAPTATASCSSGGTTAGSSASVTPPATPGSVAIDQLTAAEHPRAAHFPTPQGRTLQQMADLAKGSVQLGPATGVYVPGTERFGFALTDKAGAFIYAPTAVYIATSPTGKAQGPYLAPADPMSVEPQYRSQQNAGPGGVKAIYGAQVPIPRAGTYAVLSLTLNGQELIGADSEIAAAASSAIPNVGQRPPDIATDTLASVNGKLSLLTTRLPPENMHAVALNQVLGKCPVALLISTPQLCTSRVCGPVTDVMVQLQHEFGDRITFIHQEVYVDNDPRKGLRPQLKAFHLETEPWLFTIDRHGVIRARLEGAFGLNEARAALNAALLS